MKVASAVLSSFVILEGDCVALRGNQKKMGPIAAVPNAPGATGVNNPDPQLRKHLTPHKPLVPPPSGNGPPRVVPYHLSSPVMSPTSDNGMTSEAMSPRTRIFASAGAAFNAARSARLSPLLSPGSPGTTFSFEPTSRTTTFDPTGTDFGFGNVDLEEMKRVDAEHKRQEREQLVRQQLVRMLGEEEGKRRAILEAEGDGPLSRARREFPFLNHMARGLKGDAAALGVMEATGKLVFNNPFIRLLNK